MAINRDLYNEFLKKWTITVTLIIELQIIIKKSADQLVKFNLDYNK